MRRKKRDERVTAFELEVFGPAVRAALRLGGAFVGIDKAFALRLPPGADMSVYYETVCAGVESHPRSKVYAVVEVEAQSRGPVSFDLARDMLKLKQAVIVLIPDGLLLPGWLTAGLDRIVDVGKVKPGDLVSAAASALKIEITLAQAEQMLSFETGLWIAALRTGRAADVVLTRLREASAVRRETWAPRVEDLEGYGEAKGWALDLQKDLADWKQGRIAWADVDKGLLLGGPTGTGKTLFAGAVARSCEIPIVAASSGQWQAQGHLGDMLKAMHRSFRDAASKAPCILFIDEIDAVGDRRAFQGQNTDYSIQVVNALLELLDGSSSREGVVVIAATNYPEKVDPALRRPGRLDRQINLRQPDRNARKKILLQHLGHQLPEKDVDAFAAASSGCSGATIEQLARDAKRMARREGRAPSADDLRYLLPHETEVKSEERLAAAVHEAGHAIVGLELKIGSIQAVVVPRNLGVMDDALGHVAWIRQPQRHRSCQSYLDELAMLLAGMAAERIFFNDIFDGSGGEPGSDLQRATDLATKMLAQHGMGYLCYRTVSTDAELEELRRADPSLCEKIHRLLSEQLARAEGIVLERGFDHRRLVQALTMQEVVSGEQLSEMFGPGSIGRSKVVRKVWRSSRPSAGKRTIDKS